MGFDAVKHQERIQKVEDHTAQKKDQIKKHPWREHFHFQTPVGWMNDPHGLIQPMGSIICFINIILLVENGARCIGAML